MTECGTGVIDGGEEEYKKNAVLRLVSGRVLHIGDGASILTAVPRP